MTSDIKQPHAIEVVEDFYVNAAAVVRMVYETPLNEVKPGVHRTRVARFQERVRVQLAVMKAKEGNKPDLDEVMACVVNLERLNSAMKPGATESISDVLFDEQAAS